MSIWDFIANLSPAQLTIAAITAFIVLTSAVAIMVVALHRFTRYAPKQRRDLIKIVGLLVKAVRG